MLFHGFDWDGGNHAKCVKHGVSVAEIEEMMFRDPALFPDLAHSQAELRTRAIGQTRAGRWLFLVFTLRRRQGRVLVRPVSARYMHAREIRHYAEAQAIARSDER